MKNSQIALTILIDIIGISGIVLIGWGLWEYNPWISKAIVGGILLIVAVFATLRR